MSRLPRLLFLWPAAHGFGGVAIWLDYLLPALRERGWDPVLGLLEGPRYNRTATYLAAHRPDPWIGVPCRTGTPEGRCRALLEAFRATRPDLVVSVNTPDAFTAVARLRSKGSPMRVAMAIHGLEAGIYGDLERFREILDGVLTTNRLASRLAMELGGMDPTRVHYAPYGLESSPSAGGGPRAPRLPAEADPSTLRVGFAGRVVDEQKRVGDLVGISRALEEQGIAHHWTVAGEGPAGERLRRCLNGRATFLGAVPSPDLHGAFYGKIDVLLITSDWETGPLVAWEAMVAGVPVVSSRFVGSGLESALVDGENALLFPVGDAEAAAGQLARLHLDPALRGRIRDGGARLVRERYTVDHSVSAWERGLASILESPPLPAAPPVPVPSAKGRLERWLGARTAESVRAALGRTGPDSGSGGEWPHTYGSSWSAADFLELAERADREGRRE